MRSPRSTRSSECLSPRRAIAWSRRSPCIADPSGEGARACLTVYADAARAAADAADARARAGISLGPLDGAIVSLKDLFDVAGEVTRAGSKVLAEEGKPAAADAPVVQRLRAAGAVIVAKTNMTEFAFSGVGINPHYGTPGQCRRPRARAGRLDLGRRGRGGRPHVRDRDRQRYRRLDPHPGGAERHRRLQAEQATHSDRRRLSALLHARFDRADGAHRRGLRGGGRRDGGRGLRAAGAGSARRAAPRGRAGHAAQRSRRDRDGTVRRGARPSRQGGRGAVATRRSALFDEMVQANATGGFAPAEAYRDPPRAPRPARRRRRSERARPHRARPAPCRPPTTWR